MEPIHELLDLVWLLTVLLVYLGFDVHERLSAMNVETKYTIYMIFIGAAFFLAAAFHIHEGLRGAPFTPAIHITPLVVLPFAIYECRRLLS
jgi:hypothetical protein